jgi:DNA polymerase I
MSKSVSDTSLQSSLPGLTQVNTETEKNADSSPHENGLRLSVQQVEYSTQGSETIIHLFGRKKSGNAHHVQITGFQPYFYVLKSQLKPQDLPPQVVKIDPAVWHTIRGEEVCRLYTARPTDVRDIRHLFTHFEADIPFATRFVIDQNITSGVLIPPLDPGLSTDALGTTTNLCVPYTCIEPCDIITPSRYCILDIECEDDRGGLPYPERDNIICITCFDSFDDAYTCFLLQNKEKNIPTTYPLSAAVPNSPLAVGIHVFPTEKDLLLSFAD